MYRYSERAKLACYRATLLVNNRLQVVAAAPHSPALSSSSDCGRECDAFLASSHASRLRCDNSEEREGDFFQYITNTFTALEPNHEGFRGANGVLELYYLNIPTIDLYQPVYRLGEREGWSNWVLRQTEDGYTGHSISISKVDDDKEYFWYIGEAGEPVRTFPSGLVDNGSLLNPTQIVIADSSKGIQTWMFERLSRA
ncbi:hypothetical protein AZE42_07356 [Rhizopogon vesiculosus]|uniref:Uncharacterized protein n=1 Tax=Rhizopogon vesiculosus TaxID=180088 RepID=A0A1J8QSF6_9AGAM|nr:hypothetical protein AZE42_07356 [Rhizopogon vesiculosus]